MPPPTREDRLRDARVALMLCLEHVYLSCDGPCDLCRVVATFDTAASKDGAGA